MRYLENNGLRVLSCEFGYLIHNKISDVYSEKVYLGKFDSLDDFEEIKNEKVDDSLITRINSIEEKSMIQSNTIDAAILVLDEMLNCIESLLADTAKISYETKNPIIDFYVIMIQRELKDLNDVPIRYKEQVVEALKNLK